MTKAQLSLRQTPVYADSFCTLTAILSSEERLSTCKTYPATGLPANQNGTFSIQLHLSLMIFSVRRSMHKGAASFVYSGKGGDFFLSRLITVPDSAIGFP